MPETTDNPSGRSGGIFSSLKRMARSVAATVDNRLELLAIELQEEGIRFIGALLLVGFTLLLSGLALIMGMFAVLLAVAQEDRLLAAVLMTVALLAGAVTCGLWLAAKLKHWKPFAGTRSELRKDREWFLSSTTET